MNRMRVTFWSPFFLIISMIIFFGCNEAPKEEKVDSKPETVRPILDPPRNDGSKTAKNEKEVKSTLDRLIELAKDGNCKDMASMLIYRGKKESEKWKRSLVYKNVDDRIAVEKQCGILQVLVMDLKKMSFIEFSQEKESEGIWNIWEVKMDYLDGSTEDKFFAFLPIEDGFVLADID